MLNLQETTIVCPYCGELISVLLDCSAGSQQYYEDCPVCCAAILFSMTVDVQDTCVQLEANRDD